MRYKLKQSGLTLTEMIVVIAIVTMLTAFSLPAIKALHRSFSSTGSTQAVISAALSTARAIAASRHRYAGVRFQQDQEGNQYIIYIIHDFDTTGLAPGFCAIAGYKPVKLPDNIAVTDLMVGDFSQSLDYLITQNADLPGTADVLDITTFSITFSPSP